MVTDSPSVMWWAAAALGAMACNADPATTADHPAAGDSPGGGDGFSATLRSPVFFSDWRTVALGEANNIVQDDGKWDVILGDSLGEIIAAPAGFPTAHALSVVYNDGFVMLRTTGLPVPSAGGTRNYRWYYRHDQPDWPTDNRQHPIQDGNAISQTSWAFNTETLNDTEWQVFFGVQSNTNENPWETSRWYSPRLTLGTVYRFEVQIHLTGATTFQLHLWIFDAAGNLLFDDDDFGNPLVPPTMTLADTPTLNAHATYGITSLSGLNAGVNGVTDVTQDGFPYAVQAAFAVVDGLAPAAVIGPYGAVSGEVR